MESEHREGNSNGTRWSGAQATGVREGREDSEDREDREDREDMKDGEDREDADVRDAKEHTEEHTEEQSADLADMAERMAQLTTDNEELATLHDALQTTHARDMQLLRSRAVAAQQSFDRRIVQLQHQIKREREDFRRELDGIRTTAKKREAAWRGTALAATRK